MTCEGRPKTATTLKTIEKMHNIVLDNRRVKMCEIAEAVGILEERVEAKGGSQWFSAKECKANHICQKGHGHCVLGCQRDPVN